MSTYDNLISDVSAWLDDTRHEAKIPGFIRLAEEEHSKLLRIVPMSKKLATTTIAEVPATDFAYIARPSDFLAMRIIRLHESQSVPMDPAPISSLEFGRQDRATKYAIDASRILFNTWMGGENLLMHYYAPFTPLGPSNQMNWLLTNAYSVYLFGTLAQAGDYVYDQSKLGEWTQKFNDAIVSIKAADQRDRLGPRARVQPSVDTEIA